MPEPVVKATTVRFTFPEDVHAKIKTFQRKLSAALDKNCTFEEAMIEFIRKSKV